MEITIKGEPEEIATLLGIQSKSFGDHTPVIAFNGDLKGLAEILTPYLNGGCSRPENQ